MAKPMKTSCAASTRYAQASSRLALGATFLCLILTGGPIAAYAAAVPERQNIRPEASAGLENLPREVVGVLGSGDQLRLRLRSEDGAARTLSVGDEYKAGWILKALSSTVATLGQGNQLRQIGLNPDGDLAQAGGSSEKSSIAVLGVLTPDQMTALQSEIASGRWDGRPTWGMTQDETNRLIAYDLQRDQAYLDWYKKNFIPGKPAGQVPGRPTEADIYGSDNDDYQKLAQQRNAYRSANFQAEVGSGWSGPTTVYVPVDQIPIQAANAAGANPNGLWAISAADDTGGRTMTLVPTSTYQGGTALTGAIPAANRGTPH